MCRPQLLLLSLFTLLPALALAQDTRATLDGYVTDVQGGSIAQATQDSSDLDGHWGPSNFDIPHRVVARGTWALPWFLTGWQVDGIATWQSGQPFTVTVGAFDPVLGIANERPNQVGDPRADVPEGYSFNPAAFVAPPLGELGTVGRNTLRGDDYVNLDLGVSRRVALGRLGAGGGVQLRVEVFNVFNAVNFNFPVSTLSSGAIGRFVSNATAPRIVQLSARVSF
jgi:hypothetical protein